MKRIVDEEKRKVFLMEREGYSAKFTLLDMGEYVGYERRNWYDDVHEYWETMNIDIISENPEKNLKSEFLIDSNGRFQRLIISDTKGNRRIILAVHPNPGVKEEDYEFYYGKGIHKEDNNWLQEYYVEGTMFEMPFGKEYYYDKNKGKFIDDDGEEAQNSILADKDLGKVFRSAAYDVAGKYNKALMEKENPEKIDDVEL